MLLALHESTKTILHKDGKHGLALRMLLHPFEITRIGNSYDNRARDDVRTILVLKSYLARKVYINEENLRGRYLFDEFYQAELKFTYGLWKIFCIEIFGDIQPELPLPETYDELEELFYNPEIYQEFSLFETLQSAVLHNQIVESGTCMSLADFDLDCSLPCSDDSWTRTQYYASLTDGRNEAPERLLQAAMGMYKYDYKKVPEPYEHFWKSSAYKAMQKAVSLLKDAYIVKFRNAYMYSLKPVPTKYPSTKTFIWNVKKRA